MSTRELKLRPVPFGLGHGGGAYGEDEYLINAVPPTPGSSTQRRRAPIFCSVNSVA